jgi:hypothetical protein
MRIVDLGSIYARRGRRLSRGAWQDGRRKDGNARDAPILLLRITHTFG